MLLTSYQPVIDKFGIQTTQRMNHSLFALLSLLLSSYVAILEAYRSKYLVSSNLLSWTRVKMGAEISSEYKQVIQQVDIIFFRSYGEYHVNIL